MSLQLASTEGRRKSKPQNAIPLSDLCISSKNTHPEVITLSPPDFRAKKKEERKINLANTSGVAYSSHTHKNKHFSHSWFHSIFSPKDARSDLITQLPSPPKSDVVALNLPVCTQRLHTIRSRRDAVESKPLASRHHSLSQPDALVASGRSCGFQAFLDVFNALLKR